jgi:hypothetical protein
MKLEALLTALTQLVQTVGSEPLSVAHPYGHRCINAY